MASIFKVASGKWRVQVRRKGQAPISEYFTSHAEAVRYARGLEVDFDRQKRTPAGVRTTFATVIDAYTNSLRHKVGTTKEWNLQMLKDRLGHVRIDELTQARVSEFLKQRERDGAGPVTNMQTFSYLRTALRYGGAHIEAGEAIAEALTRMQLLWDAMMHTKQIANSKHRDRRPTDEELVQLMDHFDSRPRSKMPMTDIMLFAICTAMRQGEILRIRWEDFDEEKRLILVRGRKDPTQAGGRDQSIPLLHGHVRVANKAQDPVEIMLRQISARRRTGTIFPHSKPTVVNAWIHATDTLKINDLTFHDLRHDGVSRMFEAGYDIPQVAAVSGHKSWKNLQRYTNLRPEKVQR
jgi:integrase